MTQLAGSTCVRCGSVISGALTGQFCDACGNPVHRNCIRTGETDGTGKCPACGGDPRLAPMKAGTVRPMDWRPVVWLATIGAVALLLYWLWPMPVKPVALPTSEPTVAAEKRAKKTEPVVVIDTNFGTIRAKLFVNEAPKTVENFLDLVDRQFFDGIIFHRIIPSFMVQTGDPLGAGTGGRTEKGLPAKRLLDEFHPMLKHDRPGLLSMANSGPNTGDTQFFITTVPTPHLDNKHAIFGEVIEGMSVVRQIEASPTGANNRPIDPPRMMSVRLAK